VGAVGLQEPQDRYLAERDVKMADPNRWVRGAFVLLFLIAAHIVAGVVVAVAIFQFVNSLFAARPNSETRRFNKALSTYLQGIVQFVTYNVETKPWLFAQWPSVTSRSEHGE